MPDNVNHPAHYEHNCENCSLYEQYIGYCMSKKYCNNGSEYKIIDNNIELPKGAKR